LIGVILADQSIVVAVAVVTGAVEVAVLPDLDVDVDKWAFHYVPVINLLSE
jgi:hypothetical protein